MQYPPELYEEQYAPPSFPGISLRSFMERTTAYENLPAPFAAKLRLGAWTGLSLTLIGTIAQLLLIRFGTAINFFFCIIMCSQLQTILHWMMQSQLIHYSDALLLVSGSILLLTTHNLREGTLLQHWQAFVHALGGTANLILLAIPLTLILLSIAAWIIIIFAALLVLALVIGVLAAIL